MNRDELRANVDTIVVVIMENRSFDHVLGHLRHPQYGNRADVDGIESLTNSDYLNPNGDGIGVAPFWMADAPLPSDLPHDPPAVKKQLAYAEISGSFAMNGFVRAFEDENHTSVSQPPVMGLLRPQDVPTTGALAAQYTVCDRWFACLPTSTAPNRLMSMCGYSDHDDTGVLLPEQTTVYDWLLSHGVRWRVYAAGLPFFTLMPRLAPLLLTSHFRRLDELADDLAKDAPGDRPQVIFIEPDYHDCPVHLSDPCDNHAPLPMAPGEAFLARVYRQLSSDRARWGRTVMVVTYDEHGGFFDHVAPLPIKYRNPNGVAFDTTGPRVPALVLGPFAARGVAKAPLDNTSILQLLAERFGGAGEGYSPVIVDRARQGIASLSAVLAVGAENTRPCDLGPPSTSATAQTPLAVVSNAVRRGFDAAAKDLVFRHQAEALAKYPELRDYTGR